VKGFESDTKFQVALNAIKERKLLDEDGFQRKMLGGQQAFGGNVSMPIIDALEMLIKISPVALELSKKELRT
jgi:hypothetical protein